MVAIHPARSYSDTPFRHRVTPLAARRLLAMLVLAALLGSLALVAFTGANRARSGAVSLDGAGPSSGAPQVELEVRPVASGVHVVQPGDTLWTIARTLQPEGDVRPLVSRLLKDVGNTPLQPGQRVTLRT